MHNFFLDLKGCYFKHFIITIMITIIISINHIKLIIQMIKNRNFKHYNLASAYHF